MILARYARRLFWSRFAAALLALAAMLQLVDLMDRSDEILARGLGWQGMVEYAGLRLPLVIPPAVPIAVLAASTFTFAGLARNSEVAAMRASGLPLARLAWWLVPAGLTAAAIQFAMSNWLAPRADAAYAQWWAATDPAPEDKAVWFRLGMDVVGAAAVKGGGTMLVEVTIHRRGSSGLLRSTVRAQAAEWDGSHWVLREGRVLPPGQPGSFATAEWSHAPVPANLVELTRAQPLLPLGRLLDILAGRWIGAEAETAYRVRLWRAFAQPIVPVAMIVLAIPVAGGSRRSGGIPVGMAVGLAAGLSYLVVDGILAALGEAGTLPPWMAAGLPHAVFACVGFTMLLYAEG